MIRWPFVLRSTYQDAREDLLAERRRSEHLMDVVLDLRMAGATLVRLNGAQPTPAPKRTRSAVEQAIDENALASSDPRLRSHLARWAQKQLDAGVPEEEVCERLRAWSVVGTEDEDEDDDEAGDDVIAVGVGA